MMPAVDSSKIPVGSIGFSSDRANPTSEQPAPGGGIGAFRTECDFSHMNFDDPLLYPGQPGKSHLHAFFGNTATDAGSTTDSIASTGNSTCRGGTLNRSAYWVPAMIDTRNGAPVKPQFANIYYKTGYGGVAPSAVQPMPPGLRMIAGDAKNAEPGGPWDRMPFGYSCDDGSGNSRSIPNCQVGAELWQTVSFPQCWDGVNLDSPDHKSHMAYPDNGCPASHPVALPELTYNIVYIITEANASSHWRLASDNYSADVPGGYSGHGDWMNGWKPQAMDAFVKGCDQPGLDCHSHLLGDGRAIY